MDTDDSEAEQSLPVGLDHTGKADVAGDTLLTFPSTTSVDETVPEVPQSPNRRRKRTNEEIYEKSQPPMISTTPAKTPPRDFNLVRATSEPFHNKGSSFPKVGFSALRQEMDAEESDQKVPNTNVNAISHDEAEDSTKAIAFTEQIKLYQQKLEAEFVEFEKGLTTNDQQEIMETLDLNKLEKDYESSMTPLIEEEQRIMQEFQTRLEQCMLWMRVSSDREAERAIKRLKTRVAFVQNSETQLSHRQEHYSKVLDAFHNAMALLGSS